MAFSSNSESRSNWWRQHHLLCWPKCRQGFVPGQVYFHRYWVSTSWDLKAEYSQWAYCRADEDYFSPFHFLVISRKLWLSCAYLTSGSEEPAWTTHSRELHLSEKGSLKLSRSTGDLLGELGDTAPAIQPCCVLAAWCGVTANCFPITSPVILSTHLELWGAEWKRKRDSLAQWEQECWERCFHISVAVGVAVVVLHTGVGLGTQCWQPWGSTACKCLCCSGMPEVLIFVLLWKG